MDDFPPDLDLSAHPNDAFFKSVFSEPGQAVAFFRRHLPPAIAAHIDWQTLEVLPGSFVKTSLQQVHSDLLFSVIIGGRKCLLYLLFEHQSTPDPAMPLRLLAYMLEILLQHQQDKGLPLPPVLPFVFHQGPDAWNVSTAFEDLFSLPEEAAADLLPFLPKFRHALLDLSRFDPAAEEDDERLRMVLQLMKLARQRDLLRFFRWLAGSLVEQVPDSLLARMLLYALHADSDLDVEEIYRSLAVNPQLEHRTMSVADKLKAEGRMEGRMEGLWIGRIQTLEEFLGHAPRSREVLEAATLEELETLHRELHGEYEKRFKGR
jgi:predicted transposase/invertase (TIGR01784 family)